MSKRINKTPLVGVFDLTVYSQFGRMQKVVFRGLLFWFLKPSGNIRIPY